MHFFCLENKLNIPWHSMLNRTESTKEPGPKINSRLNLGQYIHVTYTYTYIYYGNIPSVHVSVYGEFHCVCMNHNRNI